MDKRDALRYRIAPLDMTPSEFRKAGHQLIERIAEFLCALPNRPVAPSELPQAVREILERATAGSLASAGRRGKRPAGGGRQAFVRTFHIQRPSSLLGGDHLICGADWGTGGPAGGSSQSQRRWRLGAPMGTEIEAQTVRWIAELIGYPPDCGGLLVSGGNMGNFVGLLAARRAKATWDVRTRGLMEKEFRRLRLYASSETHTWIHKATDMFGLGTNAIHWIPVDAQLRMEMISDDIRLAQELYRLVEAQSELQAFTQGLSITTFRYVPPDLTPGSVEVEAYLNHLNAELLTRLQKSGEAALSNAVVGGAFLLRACIVNFRTTLEDIEAVPGIVIRIGRELDAAIRPAELPSET